jgi:predicted nucleotidyltransferase
MASLIESRRKTTDARLVELRTKLTASAARAEGKACVYVTGSFARGEATKFSDLDLFIVGRDEEKDGRIVRVFSRLDEICVKADLIETTRAAGIPDFSGDGQYLEQYTVRNLVATLGKPEDDANNTFTARLLLLLESRSLLEDSVYSAAIGDVITAYWRDFAGHSKDFIPAFLANDILRLWRTLCVNYEAKTRVDPPKED